MNTDGMDRSRSTESFPGSYASKHSIDNNDNSMAASSSNLAGVGIFFQQDSDSNEVFVKTIVKGGSADRSGVIRMGDVVVRVDHDNVEGQPLAILRTGILGTQGTYVTLGFRRREGADITYYDVPLMRGSPEYFESLKATQPLQDEIDRLKRQNSHLETQKAHDAAELLRYRQHMDQQRKDFDQKYLDMNDLMARKDEEIARLKQELNSTGDSRREATAIRNDLLKLKESYKDDARKAEEKENLRMQYIEDLKKKMEEERQRMESQIRKLEQDLRNERRMREDAELRENRLVEDMRRKMEDDKSRKLKEQEARSKFDNERKRVQEALKLNETIAQKLKEVEPSMTQLHMQLYVPEKGTSPSPSNKISTQSNLIPATSKDDEESFFMG
uniref:PDZ domain-containing protein n=1 Tax=Guillardia theta TaxID=55529 RepID=A0A7S4P6I8_GUITH|mmetsp:Transcript_43989/g.138842  ORF Transcript_43989/g.138842 Transcript_43989/m.138842 type:complete len:387 (+) Transcript_43989:103-1263(+)